MPIKLFPPKTGRTPNYHIRGNYLGVNINRSSGTSDRKVALKVLKAIEHQVESDTYAIKTSLRYVKDGQGAYTKRLLITYPDGVDEPTFASAAIAYMQAGGERTYLPKLLEHFGETPLKQIDQTAIDQAAIATYPTASAATRNRSVYTPICAVLRHSGVRLSLRRPRGSQGNKATSWLWPEQAERLFEEAGKINKEFEALLIVLCYTGMRLSEALKLEWNNVRLEDGFAYVPTTKTDEPRAVFLPPVAVAALANIPAHGRSRIFRFAKSGHLYSLLRVAAIKAAVDLPERSAFHILRHTYGTWMRRYGGLDTRGLVGTGAWKDIKSAERYAHVVVTEEAQRAERLPIPKARKA